MDEDIETSPVNSRTEQKQLEFPKKVTISWLIQKVPVKFWLTILGVIISAFIFGIRASRISLLREISGLEKKVNPQNLMQLNTDSKKQAYAYVNNAYLKEAKKMINSKTNQGTDYSLENGSKKNIFAKISIVSPKRFIEKNIEFIQGDLNLPSDSFPNIDIKLFVHPEDGNNLYWLNFNQSTINKDGSWFIECRFGDEDPRNMKKPLPLDFTVYAVVIDKGEGILGLSPDTPFIKANNEKDFKRILSKLPYVKAISERFIVKRVQTSSKTAPQSELIVSPPVKITWEEQVPMYIEVFHKGSRMHLGKEFYYPGDIIEELKPSPRMYEIKLSRDKGFPQSSRWIIVEDKKKSFK